ncbi:MAG: hypothetical protein HY737_08000 [Candidatus Omnitrophica bacterium]|nr:hypothetical protein [Candidatus Omnitrophota bacterium]
MAGRRVLLMHITNSSGHHRASLAIARSLHELDPSASIAHVDAFHYASPVTRWAIQRLYISLIRHQPDVWEYLYDNPAVHRQVKLFRALLHRYHAVKLEQTLDSVRPDAIACTQAYPCGVVADFKKRRRLRLPLIGVLTDYAPHLYWFHDAVDYYVVPSEQVKQRFVARGIEASRVKVLGIPIDPGFLQPHDPAAAARQFGVELGKPVILIMGGSSGFGRLRDVLLHLDMLPHPCQFIVLTGLNGKLLVWTKTQRFRHRVVALSYTPDVPRLMDIATLLVSKPGGLTTSEALTKRLPLVILDPIPGQEAYNARYLVSQGAAVWAGSYETVRQTVRDLLDEPEQMAAIRRRCAELAHPQAARDTAQLLMEQ